MRTVIGVALAVVGVFFVAQSAGTVNGGFVVGAPLVLAGAWTALKGVDRWITS